MANWFVLAATLRLCVCTQWKLGVYAPFELFYLSVHVLSVVWEGGAGLIAIIRAARTGVIVSSVMLFARVFVLPFCSFCSVLYCCIHVGFSCC